MTSPVLLVYQLERSGAPLATLELAKALKAIGCSADMLYWFDGPLRDDCEKAGIALVQTLRSDQRFVLACSMVPLNDEVAALRHQLRVGLYLHENRWVGDALRQFYPMAPYEIWRDLHFALVAARFQFGDFQEHLPLGRTFELRNVVEHDTFEPSQRDGKWALSGHWEDRKGQAHLLNLAESAGVMDLRCKFVGALPERAAPRHKVEGRHVFTGRVDRLASIEHMAASDAFLSGSLHEVQPLGLLEALLAGKPALVSDIPAHREIAAHVPNVVLFNLLDAKSFRDGYMAVKERIGDVALATAARKAIEARFSAAVFRKRVQELLPVMLGTPGAPLPSVLQD